MAKTGWKKVVLKRSKLKLLFFRAQSTYNENASFRLLYHENIRHHILFCLFLSRCTVVNKSSQCHDSTTQCKSQSFTVSVNMLCLAGRAGQAGHLENL